MSIIQLTSGEYGCHIGLYHTARTDEKIAEDIQQSFSTAIKDAEEDDELSPHDHADNLLEAVGITRIYADEVIIPNL